jgi:DNA-binding NarL/FixJ family response regulator
VGRTRTVIIEDITVFREILAEVLVADGSCEIVGVSGDGVAGLALCRKVKPSLVICDLLIPGLPGLDVARSLLADKQAPRILLITAQERPLLVREAADLGVHGIVLKGTPLSTLRDGVRMVASGARFYCPGTVELLRAADASAKTSDSLSPRERQIVQMVAQGKSTKEIANSLDLSAKTVSNHRLNVMRKLDIHDVAGVTRYAISRGLVDPEEEQ